MQGRSHGSSTRSRNRLTVLCLAASLSAPVANLATAGDNARDAAAQANNPLANCTAFNLHNYYIGELTHLDMDANQFWMRYAQPFVIGRTGWIMRVSLPVNAYPVASGSVATTATTPAGLDTVAPYPKPAAPNHQTGMGDLNVFAAYLIDTGKPTRTFGFGPQITAPTAGKDALGSDKWSAGVVNILFDLSSRTLQYGYLLSWQAGFAGTGSRDDVNIGAFQPCLFYQLGGGTYLCSTGVSAPACHARWR